MARKGILADITATDATRPAKTPPATFTSVAPLAP